MSRLRAKSWVRPSAITHFPQVIEQGIYKLRQQCERRCGGLYELLNSSQVLGPECHHRSRRMRSDGLINLESFLLSLLTSTDLASGAVADPAQDAGTCMRQLDARAYGDQVGGERSMRRSERHARTLTHLGLLETIEQRHKLPQRFRSTPAVRRFDLDSLFRLLGLTAIFRVARKNILDQPRRNLIARLANARRARDRRQHFAAQAASTAAAATATAPNRPSDYEPPPRTDSAAALAAQAEIRGLFED